MNVSFDPEDLSLRLSKPGPQVLARLGGAGRATARQGDAASLRLPPNVIRSGGIDYAMTHYDADKDELVLKPILSDHLKSVRLSPSMIRGLLIGGDAALVPGGSARELEGAGDGVDETMDAIVGTAQ